MGKTIETEPCKKADKWNGKGAKEFNGLKAGNYYVVTDSHGGIYGGELEAVFEGGNALTINGRHCFSYVATGKTDNGIYALAVCGPLDGSRCGPKVRMLIRDIATVTDCSDEAKERWEVTGWSDS